MFTPFGCFVGHQCSIRLCPTLRHFPFGVRGVRPLWSIVGFLHCSSVCFIHTVLDGRRSSAVGGLASAASHPWLRDLRGSSHLGTEHWRGCEGDHAASWTHHVLTTDSTDAWLTVLPPSGYLLARSIEPFCERPLAVDGQTGDRSQRLPPRMVSESVIVSLLLLDCGLIPLMWCLCNGLDVV